MMDEEGEDEYDDEMGESPEQQMDEDQEEYQSFQKQNQYPYPKQYEQMEHDQALEIRLEQIKNNIKNKPFKHNEGMDSQGSVERMDEIIRQQRKKLESIQESQIRNQHLLQSNYTNNHNSGTPFNGEKSKEMIEFELSEASPVRKSQYSYGTGQFSIGQNMQGSAVSQSRHQSATHHQSNQNHGNQYQQQNPSSSINLEKAYEELEKEIQ